MKDANSKIVHTATNAENAIVWALANALPGDTVFLAAGTYTISKTINVNRNLVGAGMDQTRLVATGNNNWGLLEINNSDRSQLTGVTVSDLELDGRGAEFPNGQYGGLQTVNVDHCVLERLWIHDIPLSNGIELQGNSHHNVVRDCLVERIGYGGQYGNGICAGNMIQNIIVEYNLIENCTVRGCSMVGINWEPGRHNVVRNCIVEVTAGMSWSGGQANGITESAPSGWPLCTGNQYVDCTIIAPTGMAFEVWGDNILIDGCVVNTPEQHGGWLWCDGTAGLTIRNSTWHCGPSCIYVANCDNVVVEGNHFYGVRDNNTGAGVRFIANAGSSHGNHLVTNNYIEGFRFAVQMDAQNHNSEVSYNTFKNCASPSTCVVLAASDNTIVGNTVLPSS